MKIIFLDIDGVFNSRRSISACQNCPCDFTDMSLFDNIAIKLVQNLCKKTNSKVVISSTWRLQYPAEIMARFLKLPIIGLTPRKLSAKRGEEINMWVEENEVEKYCIIDDDSDMLESQKDNFIKVDNSEGFSYANYLKAIDILGI